MHAGPDSFDKQSKKWKKIARERRKEKRPPQQHCTISPYFVRKETGIPFSMLGYTKWLALYKIVGVPSWTSLLVRFVVI